MEKLLYYSDCYIFGGCEKLLLNLVASPTVHGRFEVHYAYAHNRDYQRGVDCNVLAEVRRHPLAILDNHNLFYRIDRRGLNLFATLCLKLPFALIEHSGFYAIFNFFRLLMFFRKLKPEILHINNGGYPAARSCLIAAVSARFAGVSRIILTVNNLAEKQKGLLDKLFDRYLEQQVDCFVTASSLAGEKLVQNRRFSREKVFQIFNGIPIETPQRMRDDVLAEFGVATGKFIIVTVAFLTERKGQLSLLQALNEIRRRHRSVFDDTIVFLVGDGEDAGKIRRFIAENDLSSKVILTGNREDYFNFIYAADLFVLPSLRDEDMPLVILSAMSCGKAIISTKVAGITEQVRDGVDGILINPGDIPGLVDAIILLNLDRNLGSSYGTSAKQRFHENFSVGRLVRNYLALYEGMYHGQSYKT